MLWLMSITNFVGPLGYVAGPSTFYPMVSPYWSSFLTFSLMRDSTSRLQAEHMLGKGNSNYAMVITGMMITSLVLWFSILAAYIHMENMIMMEKERKERKDRLDRLDSCIRSEQGMWF